MVRYVSTGEGVGDRERDLSSREPLYQHVSEGSGRGEDASSMACTLSPLGRLHVIEVEGQAQP